MRHPNLPQPDGSGTPVICPGEQRSAAAMRLPNLPQPDGSGTPANPWESNGVPQPCGPVAGARYLLSASLPFSISSRTRWPPLWPSSS
jgi:hypothetical protein